MHSLRTKITMLTVLSVLVAVGVITLLAVGAVQDLIDSSSDQLLLVLCESEERNLDAYFGSVQQSTTAVASYAVSDLSDTPLDQLDEHMKRVQTIFNNTAQSAMGVLTYYYRIDPTVSSEKGFWYFKNENDEFVEHEVTDITQYDMDSDNALIWFTVPRKTGASIWLEPYYTENLDALVISYNVPICKDGQFIGVIGIEIDYQTIADMIKNIKLYNSGYAFLNNANGKLIYHPSLDALSIDDDSLSQLPAQVMSTERNYTYTFRGVKMKAAYSTLINGMRLNVTVPVSEVNADRHMLVAKILTVSSVILLVIVIITLYIAGHITTPLRKLTKAVAEVDDGNYDFNLEYNGKDEVGILAHSFRNLIAHLKIYIGDLNNLAYADALTRVRNKGAFDIFLKDVQDKIDNPDQRAEFAVGIFDCDHLKLVNDQYGHDKGNIYLKKSCSLICRVFRHSPVFRIGGDEFAVIMQGDDFENRDALTRLFITESATIASIAENRWEQISVSVGVATYDPAVDRSAKEVVDRADKLMYKNKKSRKVGRRD